MMRRAAKIDDGHRDVVKMLEARGHKVLSLASLGNGAPDLLVGARRPTTRFIGGKALPDFDRVLLCLEVKGWRNQRGDLRHLTPREEDFHRQWKGWPVFVVGSPEDALRVVEDG